MAKWWSTNTVAVVTGSSKGIGYEIVKGLAKAGVTTVLTARDTGRGQKAVDSLKAEGLKSVVFHPLEITDAESIDNLAAWLKTEYGGLDILINNAGVFLNSGTYEEAKFTMDTNYYAVKAVTTKLFPLLRPGARVLNVSSLAGQLSFLGSASLAEKLGDEQHLTEEVVDAYASKYLADSKAGSWKEEGWSTRFPQYSDSKVLLNAYTRAYAKTLASRPANHKIYVNVIHPGYIATDMNNHTGEESAEEGADTPVWLALLPEENYPNGQFFFKRKPLAW